VRYAIVPFNEGYAIRDKGGAIVGYAATVENARRVLDEAQRIDKMGVCDCPTCEAIRGLPIYMN